MVRRPAAVLVAGALVFAACGEAAPGASNSPATGTPTTGGPTATTAADAGAAGAVPSRVVDGAIALLEGTPLGGIDPGDVAADVAAGCAAAAGSGGAAAFDDAVRAVTAARAEWVGEAPGGTVAARYRQVLEAAFAEVCPDDYTAVLAAGVTGTTEPGRPAGAAAETPLDDALEALAAGLEGTSLEGAVGDSWPVEDLTGLLDEVCRIAEGGGSNVDVLDAVVDEVLLRFDPDQGDLDMATIAIVTVAVADRCPELTDEVLGP